MHTKDKTENGEEVPTGTTPPARTASTRPSVESVVDTFKGQLDLERHGGRTPTGVLTRVWQRVPALTAVVWRNEPIGQPVKRSLTAHNR